jgi:hypothetical protein
MVEPNAHDLEVLDRMVASVGTVSKWQSLRKYETVFNTLSAATKLEGRISHRA